MLAGKIPSSPRIHPRDVNRALPFDGLEPILKIVLLETRPEQLLNVLTAGAVGTNSFLRRVRNVCAGMNWLPWPARPRAPGIFPSP